MKYIFDVGLYYETSKTKTCKIGMHRFRDTPISERIQPKTPMTGIRIDQQNNITLHVVA
jgi:hypothetical protein